MLRLFITLGLLFVSHHSWGQSCLETLQDWSPPAWLGEYQQSESHEPRHFLGEGYMGGPVYLMKRGEEQYLIKHYKRKQSLDNDIAAWDLLRELLKDDPRYLIPKFERLDDLTLEMSYIPTTDLKRLNETEKDSPRVKHWNETYHDLITTIREKNRDYSFYTSFRPHYMASLHMLEVKKYFGPAQSITLLLKADNVAPVPGNKNQILIFDPF